MNKKMIPAVLCVGALGLSLLAGSVAQAASNKTYKGVDALGTTQILGMKAPAGLTVGRNDMKMMSINGGNTSVKQSILDAGAMGADVYQLMYKNNNSVDYGVLAQINVGITGARNILGLTGSSSNLTADIAKAINTGSGDVANQIMPYKVVEPLRLEGKNYVGTLQTNYDNNGTDYTNNIHMVVYDDKYAGPTIRALAINADDESTLWPALSPLMKVKR